MLYNKKVLITNDDGFEAEGIKTLVEQIYLFTKDIIVIAPKNNSSAASHSITLKDGMKLVKELPIYKDVETYSLTGSPADCVSVGIVYLEIKPDYVISGINNGLNMGIDILYSGTVAACFEAGIHNVKAIAFSCERNELISASQIPSVINYINNIGNYTLKYIGMNDYVGEALVVSTDGNTLYGIVSVNTLNSEVNVLLRNMYK